MSSSPLCLVTGGCGFLGRYVVERLLEEGYSVRVFDLVLSWEHEQVEFIRGDLTRADEVSEALCGVDTCFHVASLTETWGEYDKFYAVNVIGTRNIIQGCINQGVRRLVYTSTPSVVIAGSDIVDGKEDIPYPDYFLDNYTSTKAIAEQEVLQSNGVEGLSTCSLRPHAMFGPRDNHFFPQVIDRARAGKITFMIGSTENVVDFTYVGNVADAHFFAMKALADGPQSPAAGNAYFITNGEPVKFWDFMRDVVTGLGFKFPKRRIPYAIAYAIAWTMETVHGWVKRFWNFRPPLTRYTVANMCTDHWFSIEKAKKDLGYEPRVSLQDALRETLQYYRDLGLANDE